MFVENMTYAEMIEEYKKTAARRVEIYKRYVKYDKYLKHFQKNPMMKNVYFRPVKVNIDPNTNLYLIPFGEDYRSVKKYSLTIRPYMVFQTSRGMYVMSTNRAYRTEDGMHGVFTPHFFDRYRERYLHDEEMDKMEVIEHYFKHCGVEYRQDMGENSYGDEENSFVGTNKLGLILGVKLGEDALVYKTFIGFDDLSCNKTMLKELVEAIRKKGHDTYVAFMNSIKDQPRLQDYLKYEQRLSM